MLMEGKKLNLNQPLLSVRKYSPKVTSKTVDETKTRPVIPRTPPYRSEMKSGPVGNPGAVPFQWEQIPGRPKEEMKRQVQNVKLPPKAKKYDHKIESVDIPHDSVTGSFMDVKISVSERSKEKSEENKSSDSGNHDEVYVDALESFLLHCGMNGGLSMDQLTREFIKDKFLPQYAVEKQSADRQEEKSEDECDQHVNLPSVCCLLPRFCLKSSICILNPVHAMSMRTRVLTSSGNRIQPRFSSANEYKPDIPELKPDESKHGSIRLKGQNTLTRCQEKEVFAAPEETGIKGLKTFQELLAEEESPNELDSTKTTIHVPTIENTRYCSADTQDTQINTKKTYQMRVTDSSLEDFKKVDSNTTEENTKVTENKDCKSRKKQPKRTLERSHEEKYRVFVVPPPLPSPSDSWLRRTLPTYINSSKKTGDIKWEDEVKSTKV